MTGLLVKFQIEPNVTVSVFPDEFPDWSWVEDEETLRDINNGKLQQVYIFVEACDSTGIVTGLDELGGVVVGYDDHKQEIRDAIDANEMIEIAKKDLEEKLKQIRENKE